MTDLISSLADQIIALVNSKPSSPRKEEVEAAIRAVVGEVEAPQVMVNWAWLKATLKHAGMGRPPDLAQMAGETPLCHAAFEDGPDPPCRACGTPYSQWRHIHCDEALAAKALASQTALIDAMNTTVYGGPTIEDREKFWANKLGRHDFLAGRCYCGAYEY